MLSGRCACQAVGYEVADEILTLHVAATRPLAEAATALDDAVTGRSKGANVLTLDRS